MSKKGEIKKLSKTQRIALLFSLDRLKTIREQMQSAQQDYNDIMKEVTEDLQIPEIEKKDWYLIQNGFEYRPKPKKQNIPKGNKKYKKKKQ